jgi:hypothetical protein
MTTETGVATAAGHDRQQAAISEAARRLYDAETALHAARQSGIGAWISAAYDRLSEAIADHTRAVAAPQAGTESPFGRVEERPVVLLVDGAFPDGAGDPVAAWLTARVAVVRDGDRGRGGGGRAPSAAEGEAGEFEALTGVAGGVVLVFGAWPGGVLVVDGPLLRRLVLGEPAPATDGSRPPRLARPVAWLAGLVPADRHGSAVEYCLTTAGQRAGAASDVFRREGEYWTVCYQGSVVRLKDTKGLHHLARLLARPGRELHATGLEAAESQAAPAVPAGRSAVGAELGVRPDLGDAGELLDATAKASYKARLDDLRAELEEAERINDPARAARALYERDFLVGELARAVGLGGRDRRAASHAERARLNTTRAIRAAMANIARAHPSLGRHLAATIRTGRYCCYAPDPRAPIDWAL